MKEIATAYHYSMPVNIPTAQISHQQQKIIIEDERSQYVEIHRWPDPYKRDTKRYNRRKRT